jgi:hypothetical protein
MVFDAIVNKNVAIKTKTGLSSQLLWILAVHFFSPVTTFCF